MWLKALLICLLLFVLFNLFRALPIMIKGNKNVPMSRYLGRRVLLSVCIIFVILLAVAMGIIAPNERPF